MRDLIEIIFITSLSIVTSYVAFSYVFGLSWLMELIK